VAKDQEFEPLDVAKVSPFIVEHHELAGVLLIPWLLLNAVDFEDFAHKIIYGPSLRCNDGVSRDEPLKNRAACIYPASRWTTAVSGPWWNTRAFSSLAQRPRRGRHFVQGL